MEPCDKAFKTPPFPVIFIYNYHEGGNKGHILNNAPRLLSPIFYTSCIPVMPMGWVYSFFSYMLAYVSHMYAITLNTHRHLDTRTNTDALAGTITL